MAVKRSVPPTNNANAPKRQRKLADLVRFLIGPQEEEFVIPAFMFTHVSYMKVKIATAEKYFDPAMETALPTIRFPNASAAVFWCYNQFLKNFTTNPMHGWMRNCPNGVHPLGLEVQKEEEDSLHILMNLYLFGHSIQDTSFTDFCIDTIVSFLGANSDSPELIYDNEDINKFFANTVHGCAARKFFAEYFMCTDTDVEILRGKDGYDLFAPQFWYEVTMVNKENMKAKAKAPKPWDAVVNDPCRYHDHERMGTRCYIIGLEEARQIGVAMDEEWSKQNASDGEVNEAEPKKKKGMVINTSGNEAGAEVIKDTVATSGASDGGVKLGQEKASVGEEKGDGVETQASKPLDGEEEPRADGLGLEDLVTADTKAAAVAQGELNEEQAQVQTEPTGEAQYDRDEEITAGIKAAAAQEEPTGEQAQLQTQLTGEVHYNRDGEEITSDMSEAE